MTAIQPNGPWNELANCRYRTMIGLRGRVSATKPSDHLFVAKPGMRLHANDIHLCRNTVDVGGTLMLASRCQKTRDRIKKALLLALDLATRPIAGRA